MSDVKPPFTVRISEYQESHRLTYWVTLINNNTRPENASFFDKTGRIQPSYFENREHAVHTAKEWAEFLGVEPPEECTCLMCKYD